MKFRLTILAILSLCTTVVAQKIDSYYVSRVDGNSMVYFLKPQTLMKSAQEGSMTYDLTVLRGEGRDSVRMNFTYHSKSVLPIDSIQINSKSVSIGAATERIYIEPSKEAWVHRYGFVTTLPEFYPYYSVDAPPTITLYNAGKEVAKYDAIEKEWQKYSPVALRIFGMIRLN